MMLSICKHLINTNTLVISNDVLTFRLHAIVSPVISVDHVNVQEIGHSCVVRAHRV